HVPDARLSTDGPAFTLLLLHSPSHVIFIFFFNAPAPSTVFTLSLPGALPIYRRRLEQAGPAGAAAALGRLRAGECGSAFASTKRSEEHTSELQSRGHLVCRLLLEKKNKTKQPSPPTSHCTISIRSSTTTLYMT